MSEIPKHILSASQFGVYEPKIVHTIEYEGGDAGSFQVGLIDLYMYWASALINGDYSGLDDRWDMDACRAVEVCLKALGWRVVHTQEYGDQPYEREWHGDDPPEDGNRTCDPFFGSSDHWPDSGKGDILTYVCHREMP